MPTRSSSKINIANSVVSISLVVEQPACVHLIIVHQCQSSQEALGPRYKAAALPAGLRSAWECHIRPCTAGLSSLAHLAPPCCSDNLSASCCQPYLQVAATSAGSTAWVAQRCR